MKKKVRVFLNVLGILCILAGTYFVIHTFYSRFIIFSIAILLFGILILPMTVEKIQYEFVKIKSWMIYSVAFFILVIGVISLPKDGNMKPEYSLFYADDADWYRIFQNGRKL